MLTHVQATEALAELVRAVTAGQDKSAEEWLAWLAGISGSDWLRLDDVARGGGAGVPLVWGSGHWHNPKLTAASELGAVVASMHADGRVRERATRELAARRGSLAAASLALRVGDHVPQVRTRALTGLLQLDGPEEAEAALSVLGAGKGRQLMFTALEAYSELLCSQEASLLDHLRGSKDRTARRWAYEKSIQTGRLDVDALLHAVRREPDQLVRKWCVHHVGAHGSLEQRLALLSSGFVEGRLTALQCLPDAALQMHFEKLLVDGSPRVRESAQVRARRAGIDPASFYRSALGRLRPPRDVACIAALAVTGSVQDLPRIERYLSSSHASERAAAVTAVSLLSNQERCLTLGSFLLDPSPKVAAAAEKALARSLRLPKEIEQAWRSPQPWSRRAAWRLQRARGSWSRVEADLRATLDSAADLAAWGGTGLRSWLTLGAATTWGAPEGAQAERLHEMLGRVPLTEKVLRQLAFHASLPMPVTGRLRLEEPGDDLRRAQGFRGRLLRLVRRHDVT